MEQEQEAKNTAPEPEVTQSNEEDSDDDDDVLAPSGSPGSGEQLPSLALWKAPKLGWGDRWTGASCLP